LAELPDRGSFATTHEGLYCRPVITFHCTARSHYSQALPGGVSHVD
jgi:hypothetical protein